MGKNLEVGDSAGIYDKNWWRPYCFFLTWNRLTKSFLKYIALLKTRWARRELSSFVQKNRTRSKQATSKIFQTAISCNQVVNCHRALADYCKVFPKLLRCSERPVINLLTRCYQIVKKQVNVSNFFCLGTFHLPASHWSSVHLATQSATKPGNDWTSVR